jgi:hypothetical protein
MENGVYIESNKKNRFAKILSQLARYLNSSNGQSVIVVACKQEKFLVTA